MAFEVATFTDVTAAESVNGLDGFHFQSVSPGFTGEDMAVVQGELNFVPTPTWGTVHGNETSHPEQCSYVVRQGRHYLTRSIALGLTANGRPGNQLTEAAATSAADDLVPYSPAQLMTATAWSLAKAAGVSREPWMTPLQIDPLFEDLELEQFTRSDPWALRTLPVFLTMLQRSLSEEGHRVFIQHRDPRTVLRWIALGSMLLGAESAMRLTFRVFTANPWNGAFHVVGVHPDLLALVPAAAWQNLPSASWIDLDSRTHKDLEASELAQHAVRWFAERGVFEAMGAIQLATQLQEPLGEELAVSASDLLTFGGDAGRGSWELACRVATGLVEARQAPVIETFEDELIDAITTFQPREDRDFAAVAEVITGALDAGLTEFAVSIAAPALEALAASPHAAGAFATGLTAAHARLVWTDAESRAAAGRAWATALAGAQDPELSSLFAATTRLGLDIDRELLIPAAERLASQWAARPALGVAREHWYAAELIEELVAVALRAELEAGDPVQLQALLRGDWAILAVNPRSPLAGWLRAADLATRAPSERTRVLDSGTVDGVPEASWRLVLKPAAGELSAGIDVALWAAFIRRIGLPQAMGVEIVTRVERELAASELTRDAEGTAFRWAPLFVALDERRSAVGALPLPVVDLLDRVHRAREAGDTAHRDRAETPNRALRAAAGEARLWAMDRPARTGELLVRAADREGAARAADVLGEAAGQTVDAFLNTCDAKGRGEEGLRTALLAYAGSAGLLRDQLGASTLRFVEQHSDIKRALRRDEAIEPLIKEVSDRYAERSPGLFSQVNSWFGGKR